jgi:hypothetical protein
MRWLVEVSSIGKTDLQKFCVEAESWQRALQAARAQRGEEGPMSGFSIELLEEGYRAVDPVARVRFVVKRAPDDMPITASAKETKGTGVAPSPPSAIAGAGPSSAAVAAPTEPKLPPSPASSAPVTTKSSTPPRPAAEKSNGPASTAQKKAGLTFNSPDDKPPPSIAPVSVAPATNPSPSSAPAAPVGSALPGLPAVKVLSAREQNPTDASPLTYREYSFAVATGTSEDVAVEVLRGQLKLVDAHLAAAKMGKLVNLAVFDVEFTGKPPGPPLATLSWKDWKGDPVIGYPRRGAAQKLVKPPSGAAASGAASASPQSALFPPASIPPSNIAGSNVPRPGAQAALAAAVAAPAAPASSPTTSPMGAPIAAPAGFPPPATAIQAMVAAAQIPQAAQPAPQPAANPFAAPAPGAPNPFAPSAQPAAQNNPFPVSPSSLPPANPFSSTAPMIPQALLPQQPAAQPASIPPPAPQMHSQPPPAPQMPSQPPPQMHSQPPPAPPVQSQPPPQMLQSQPPPAPQVLQSQPPPQMNVAVFTPGMPASVPPPAVLGYIPQLPPPGSQKVPAAAPAAASEPPPRRPSQHPAGADGMVRTPSGRFVRGRTTGDELITALFESMHDLHFLRDALDGGQFCLALATEVLPARAAIIHFYDIEKREWVVACTRGKDTSRLLTLRTPEGDELLRDAARKRRAIVTPNASAATAQRYQTLGGSRSMIIAPIMQAGRALGAIEIINPLDGMPFTEDEGNAMTYIAEQYAEYLGSRGIVLDRERIQSAASPR